MQTSILYFDQFELDLNSYELRKSGRVIKLEKLPMELLILLAESQGQLVTREQIIQRLWGDNVFVDTRQGINTAMRKLRIALQDDSENPRLLQTVPGRGYRLLAAVSSPAAGGGQTVEPAAVPPSSSPGESALADAVSKPKKRWHATAMAGVLVVLLAIGGLVVLLFYRNPTNSASRNAWIKITNFSDSATQPAFSPDGHMIVFIRGPETFVTPGEVYVKILPDGEPVQLTHDGLPKMAPAFSPDGSRIAYTATDRSVAWNTWVVPVLGGEPKEMLPNAAGLTWLDREHVMFSEANPPTAVKLPMMMGLVSARESRAEERDIYLPPGRMAHRSWVSPDRKWVLVSEMDTEGWGPCRVIPFDGSTKGELVGPKPVRCTYAGWSPDGVTMYFSADAGDGYHIWSQAFPRGKPEQITFGPTEEEGVAVTLGGRSLVTSAGIRESTVWVHDARGDRQMSSEGFAGVPGLGWAARRFVRFSRRMARSCITSYASKLRTRGSPESFGLLTSIRAAASPYCQVFRSVPISPWRLTGSAWCSRQRMRTENHMRGSRHWIGVRHPSRSPGLLPARRISLQEDGSTFRGAEGRIVSSTVWNWMVVRRKRFPSHCRD